MKPPATDPVSIAAPDAICPRANTASRSPSKPVALSASTSQASTAPEKNVKPSPIRTETTAHAQNGASSFQSRTYSSVAPESVSVPRRYEARRPTVSATIPVGTSKSIIPAVKNAFAANASRFERPASSRKIVLIPQISDAASVFPRIRVMYVRWTERGVSIPRPTLRVANEPASGGASSAAQASKPSSSSDARSSAASS